MSEFHIKYGPKPTIFCTDCLKQERMVASRGGEVSDEDTRRYQRQHVCGRPGGPWDIADDEVSEVAR